MSKLIEATCNDGVVTALGVTVDNVVILSEGVGASSGVLILDEDSATYIAKTSPDLKTTILKAITALTETADGLSKVASTLTSIGSMMTGPTTAPPPTLPADVATINAHVADIESAVDELQTLSEDLK